MLDNWLPISSPTCLVSRRTARIAIVVPAWNALHFLSKTLPSMKSAAAKHGEAVIVVVDNGSTDGTSDFLRREHPDVIAVRTHRQSIGAARNIGARAVESSIIAFVDADCLMAEDHLIQAERLLNDPEINIAGNSYDLPDEPGWVERVWHSLHKRPVDGVTRLLPAGNFVIRREVFDALGGFNETLVTGEDAEFCHRLSRAGHYPFASRSIRVAHLGNPKNLKGFFSRNVWHSLGMFGTVGTERLNRPLIMTALHFTSTILGLSALTISSLSLATRGGILALSQLTVPALSVAYRLSNRGAGITWTNAVSDLSRAILLYWFYYWARLRAIQLLIQRRGGSYVKSS